MTRLATVATAALLGVAALAEPASAQVVIGTRPIYAQGTVVTPYGVVSPSVNTPGAAYTSGYYSPYPGYLYSPFVNNYGYGYGYNVYNYGYGGITSGGYGLPRSYMNHPAGGFYARPLGTRYYRY